MSEHPHAVMVQGASRGIGLELARQLYASGHRVVATCRDPHRATELQAIAETTSRLMTVRLDVRDESSIVRAADAVASAVGELTLLINAAGLLHEHGLQPEKQLAHVDRANLRHAFEVNAFGPLLVAKHFSKMLIHGRRAVIANISARVGSITDNRLGGWYAYRASKAAQNMFTATMAIELARRSRNLIVVALHPGTVDTDLSKPFQRNVPPHKLFDVARGARQLLEVIRGLTRDDHGKFLAYDNQAIPW